MKFLRRFAIILAVLTAIALLLVPGIVGLLAERFIPEGIAQFNTQMGRTVFTVERFERGWFSSNAELSIQPSGGNKPKWRYRAALTHGPYPLLNPAWLSDRATLTDGNDRAAANVEWAMGLDSNATANISVDWRADNDYLAGQLAFETARGMREITAHLTALDWSGSGTIITEAALETTLQVAADGIWTGPIKAQAARIEGSAWSAQSIAVEGAIEHQDNALALGFSGSSETLVTDAEYRDAYARIRIDGLDWPTLEILLSNLRRTAASGLSGRALQAQLQQEVITVVPVLLQRHPGIALESLRFMAPEGAVSGNFAIAVPGDPAPGFITDVQRLLLPALALQWQARLPQALTDRWTRQWVAGQLGSRANPLSIEETAEDIVRRGRANQLLQPQGDSYVSELNYADGQLTIGGQSMTLPVF